MIGIVGPPGDHQVVSVADHLRARGVEPILLDLSCSLRSGRISLLDGAPAVAGLDIQAVDGWYVRSLPLPLPFQPLDQEPGGGKEVAFTVDQVVTRSRQAYAAGREQRSFLFSVVGALERAGAAFVNPPTQFSQHFLKLDQLERLRSAGVPIPRTLATNDPEAVLKFAGSTSGPIVYKPVAGGGLCRRATEDDLRPERLRLLANAPVLFQEEVPGRNLRVYVVGYEAVASYEIVSDELDYRGAECAVLPARLGDDEREAACRAARACGLRFTGIDIRRRPDGSFAVLECNPSPMFSGIERRTGDMPVSRALADLLLSSARPGAHPEALASVT